jgi:two-component system sensor histidine kinase KdpD
MLGTAAELENDQKAKDFTYVKEAAHNLVEAGDRLNRVIENLLDMSRLSSGILSLKLEWHDLSDLIGVVISKNTKNLKKFKIVTQGLDDMTLIKIDFRLMEHAISNLLLNAATYSPLETQIKIRLIKEEKKLILEIEDEGPGIPQEFTSKIFDKFYRVPGTPTGGTGLGLSIVKSIVEFHNGSVSFRNCEPQGSCFRIELPREEGPEIPTEIQSR